MQNIQQAINRLTEHEAKKLLQTLFSQTEQLDDEALGKVVRTIRQSLSATRKEHQLKTVHLVFHPALAGALRHTFKKVPSEQIISFPDILSVGPVEALHTQEGIEQRFRWLREHLRGPHDQQEFTRAVETIHHIPPHVPILIWTSNNAAEQTGLRFAAYLLQDAPNEISELNTKDAFDALHVAVDGYTIDIRHSGELSPEQLHDIYAHVKPWQWNPIRRAAIEEEGMSLMYDEFLLRKWEYGELWSADEERHDAFVMKCAKELQKENSGEYFQAIGLIGKAFGELEDYTGDSWIEYRVRELIRQGDLEVRGDLTDWRKYEIRVVS
ncbi:DUF1835 domain-containing protein [Sporosarcina sp. PTS2304]|uniref:DUF1835 domain-containing protein n=1 Tax=Sporosarcina sp. PTS2304 TaxID=2283194 RepID=UPI0013B36D87|nr:DUF1835 domain-containing protein [Sporosarcina sp. PTS2304]